MPLKVKRLSIRGLTKMMLFYRVEIKAMIQLAAECGFGNQELRNAIDRHQSHA